MLFSLHVTEVSYDLLSTLIIEFTYEVFIYSVANEWIDGPK